MWNKDEIKGKGKQISGAIKDKAQNSFNGKRRLFNSLKKHEMVSRRVYII
jgi:hypothetical protein